MRFKKYLFSIVLLLSLSIGITPIAPALAVTIEFSWSGNNGYTARGSFRYDEKTAPALIHEEGAGRTKVIEKLEISFLDPRGKEIARYDNVFGGVSDANYFRFNFDTRTGEIFGSIDLGGESAGETYLKGIVKENLALFHVGEDDVTIDEDRSPEIVTRPLLGSSSSDRHGG
ncbi:hypothetical protein V0288_20985 [Pannus brasiliensis CCIBt3594]|uniref:Uncharacterized protein n=1 Tax=Pannus brasiliensis CCIBt3594 TaxID=1427578 RepID=A0AAW9QWW3_9CHRO